jgi:hypothetical protein
MLGVFKNERLFGTESVKVLSSRQKRQMRLARAWHNKLETSILTHMTKTKTTRD